MASAKETARLPERGGRDDGELRVVVLGTHLTTTHLLPKEGTVRLGRGEDMDIRIDHPSASRAHLVIELGARLTVTDLDSANGTFLRGVRLPARQPVELAPGDALEVGAALVVLQGRAHPRAGSPSPTAADVTAVLGRVAQSTISVLILGETGVGKEVFAAELVRRSARAAGPYLRLNCAALAESLLESELFGHERGAFTGATQQKAGLLESANGGTVLLDEVGEMPLSLQAKLLRVLEAREVLRVGAVRPIPIDVRILSATHRDLDAEIEAGRFRKDLFYRLNGFTLHLPPLRERLAELPELCAKFIAEAAERERLSSPPVLTPEALERLRAHLWPGNLRELRNVIDRAVVLAGPDPIIPAHLPAQLGVPPLAPASEKHTEDGHDPTPVRSLRAEVEHAERERILKALQACSGNQTQAAKALGISRRTLVARLAQYQLPRPRAGRARD